MKTFQQLKRLLCVGMTEKQIARLVVQMLKDNRAEKAAFPPIVALSANAVEIHHKPTDRKARKGDSMVLDMGGVYNGMRSDMTRTLFFGAPNSRVQAWYNAVLESQKRAYRGVRAGRTGKSIDAIARSYLATQKLDQYFLHSLGHGVGKAIHQPPWLSPKKGYGTLKNGDVVTIEPGVYIKKRCGIRIEDMCVVGKERGSWLVQSQRHISRMIL